MATPSYTNALISIIPDVIDSLDYAISKGEAAKAPTPSNDGRAFELASLLKESVICVQDTLLSDNYFVNEDVLEALNDSVECCRLLASALLLGHRDDGSQSKAGSGVRRGDGTAQITRRLLESMDFLCDNAHSKESSVEQRQLRKCTRAIGEDYQSLALLLHDREKGETAASRRFCSARRASFPGLSSPSQLSSKLRETRAGLETLFFGGLRSQEYQRSRSIDRQLREEQFQPWARSDCVMVTQGIQRFGPFKPSLAAFTCEDRQRCMDDLRNEVVRHFHRFLCDDTRLDEMLMPGEARPLAADLRSRLKDTDVTITDRELGLLEYLWTFKAFRSIADDIGVGSWVSDASLVTSILGKAREIMRNEDYVLTVGDAAFALRKDAFRYVNHFTYGGRQVSILDWHANPSLAKRWRHRFGRTPTFIALFDLSTYDDTFPDLPELTSCGEYLEFFDSMTKEPCFRDTTFLLYLVNATKFREKLRRVPMADHVPGFAGGDDPDGAAEYILREFTSRVEGRHKIRVRVCDFMDPLNVDFLFTSVDHAVRQRQIVKRIRGYDPAAPNPQHFCTCGAHAPRAPY